MIRRTKRPAKRPTRRHALSTRLWHWLNVICVVIMFMSGLNISNAHPRLYWGQAGFAAREAWLHLPTFPGWATIPGYYSLSGARDWHLLMAWPFAIGLLAMWVAMLANRHFVRDLTTRLNEWRWSAIRADIAAHLRFDFDHGGGKYNFLQKLAYGVVLGILLPGMILTGLAISPGIEPGFGWFVQLVGGRQSARSIHFLFAWGLALFAVLHIVLVIASGPIRQLRDMVTGGRAS
ncbi:cytochrome b/b6 domain-containing protein [Tsuneonella flava]|uniref:cytochrome b/b6 domain-containing protein n=1 Tax=Tsuneonella flava TaxID=2055955 RepID=UPI001F1576F6|nr:cytochrome b/b6 domain-containing protein [Tsuneonella flava]